MLGNKVEKKRCIAVVAAVLGVALLTACGGSSGAATGSAETDRPVSVAILEQMSAFPLYVAEDQGYLKEAGIGKVEPRMFTSIPSQLTAVAKGQVDLGSLSMPPVAGYNASASDSNKIQTFSVYGVNMTGWAARGDSGLPNSAKAGWKESVQAWKGKTVGVPALGGQMEMDLRYMLTQAGLTLEDVQIVPVGAGQAAVVALQQRLVDVIGGGPTVLAEIEAAGTGYVVLGLEDKPDVLKDTIASIYFGSEARLGSDSAFYRGLTKAVDQARSFIAEPGNKEAVVRVLVNKVGLKQDIADKVYDLCSRSIANGSLDQKAFDRTIAALKTTGVLSGDGPSYEGFVAEELVK